MESPSVSVPFLHLEKKCVNQRLIWNSPLSPGSFFRATIPLDITEDVPRPWNWGPPSAVLAPTMCEIDKFFKKHVVVFGALFLCLLWSFLH